MVKAIVAYLVVAWMIIEVTSIIFPALLLPEWAHRLVVILAAAAFPIVVVLSWVFDVTPGGITRTEEHIDSPSDNRPGLSERSLHRLPPAVETAVASIVVLPFEVLSSDDEDKFIAQGICAEISRALSKLVGVRVVHRTPISTEDKGTVANQFAQRLEAQYVLTGSLRRQNEHIRLIVDLADTASGAQLWSETYDRALHNVLEIEEEIANAIVGSIGGEHMREQIRIASTVETKNPTAWGLTHKARSYILNYGRETLVAAESLARKALELDPDYALAHATLADVLSERIINGLSEDADSDLVEAVNAIGIATASSVDDPFVLKLAGNVWRLAGQHDKATECLRRAVELSPFDLGAWGYLGGVLAASDNEQQLQEAEEILTRILEMAPQHPGAGFWWHHRALVSTCRLEFGDAISFAERAIQIQPRFAWAWYLKANALASDGDETGAREALKRAHAANSELSNSEFIALVEKTSATPEAAARRLSGIALIEKN